MNNKIIVKDKIIKQDSLLKILNMLVFPIEFILSIILVVGMYHFLCDNKYEGKTNIISIIISIFSALGCIGIIIYNYKRNPNCIEKIFISFMIPIGMMYLIFMIPTYVPDEYAHMWKSYQISEGIIITPIDEDGVSHTEVPKFFKDNIVLVINKYSDMNKAMQEKTDYNDKIEVETTAQNYSPILYLFTSIGLAISRLFGLNGFIAQYISRMLNFILFLVLSYYTIKIIPFGKLLVSCFLFIPIIIQQATSFSADCMINSVLIFFIAYNLYLIKKETDITKKEQVLYFIISIFVGIAKFVYVPLVALSLLLIQSKKLSKKNKIILIVSSLVFTAIVAVLWYIFSIQYHGNEKYLLDNNVNSTEQIMNIVRYPLHAVKVLYETTLNKFESYVLTFLGSSLGWFQIGIPVLCNFGFAILVILSIYFEKNEFCFNIKEKVWTILIFLGTYALVLMALYISWTSVGVDIVEGVQGRYFVPIMLLPLLCFSKKENYVKINNINMKMMILLSLLSFKVISKIIVFFL